MRQLGDQACVMQLIDVGGGVVIGFAAQGQSDSRKTVAEVPLTGLS